MLIGYIDLGMGAFLTGTVPTPVEIRYAGDMLATQMEAIDRDQTWQKTAVHDYETLDISYYKENILSEGQLQIELDMLRADGFDPDKAIISLHDTETGVTWYPSVGKEAASEGAR